MICPKCGNDTYHVIKVLRNRRNVQGRFKVNDHVDSRILVCKLCGQRVLSESVVVAQIFDRNFKVIIKDKDGEFKFEDYLEP